MLDKRIHLFCSHLNEIFVSLQANITINEKRYEYYREILELHTI